MRFWCFIVPCLLISFIYLFLIFQVLNMLCCWVEDPNSEAFKLHLPRLNDFLWVAEDGMKMQVKAKLLLFCFRLIRLTILNSIIRVTSWNFILLFDKDRERLKVLSNVSSRKLKQAKVRSTPIYMVLSVIHQYYTVFWCKYTQCNPILHLPNAWILCST